MMNIAIIGGGAAGFFAAVNLKRLMPQASITIFEKQDRVLKKLLISGGGRCNLTNTFEGVTDLSQVYPRGFRLLKGLFKRFNHEAAVRWFEAHDVPVVAQEDHCVFPVSQDAHSVAGCLTRLAGQQGVSVRTSCRLERIVPQDGLFELYFRSPAPSPLRFDRVIVTTGGSPRREGLHYLEALGHQVEQPVPSLFTFNIADEQLRQLSGLVCPVSVGIPGTKFRTSGPLLVTHWGMSGPAILKLSSHAARHLYENGYRVPLSVNWAGGTDQERVTEALRGMTERYPQKTTANVRPFDLTSRFWEYLLDKAGIPTERRWAELGKKNFNRLADVICNDRYTVEGKSTCREEFVTCGGISLDAVHRHTLESKSCLGLYFAGEVLDIDGVTGGFNFQAAWTTGFTVANAIAESAPKD